MTQTQKANFDRHLKLLPQNLDAERCVLGCIILLPSVLDEIRIRPSHMYSERHATILTTLREMYRKGTAIDGETLVYELERKNELDNVGGPLYIAEIMDSVPHAAHVLTYCKPVEDAARRRDIIESLTQRLREAYDLSVDVDEIKALIERDLLAMDRRQASDQQFVAAQITPDVLNIIDERVQCDGSVTGLTSGFSDFDSMTTGFQAANLIVLAARPAMGKTAFVCNFILNATEASDAKPILFFSLEQSRTEIVERFLCILGRVNGHDVRAGELESTQRNALFTAATQLERHQILIDDRPRRKMRDIASIARELKAIAKELDVPVVALAQLNRGVEHREDKRPRLADLRESGAIEQEADIVTFLHRPDAYDPEDRPSQAEVIIAKHRSGPTGIVRLSWRKEHMRFEDYSPLSDVDF